MSSPVLPNLTQKEVNTISEMWISDWRTGKPYEAGNTGRWWKVLGDFLNARGDQLVTADLQAAEERVIRFGKSKEYLAALATIVNFEDAHDQHDQVMLVLTASPEERRLAVKKVLS